MPEILFHLLNSVGEACLCSSCLNSEIFHFQNSVLYCFYFHLQVLEVLFPSTTLFSPGFKNLFTSSNCLCFPIFKSCIHFFFKDHCHLHMLVLRSFLLCFIYIRIFRVCYGKIARLWWKHCPGCYCVFTLAG